MSKKAGAVSEQNAKRYLLGQGLKWLVSNYSCRWGEIDLIMQETDWLVFIEVRARSSASFGGAAASVTYSKQQKLLKTASHYLLTNKIHNKQPVRFDVLSFEGSPPEINWIKNAFGVDF
ncbi:MULTISPECIES: YraN family protein [unclassified Legionella]|uniref:YraN family protein n=1 Tax=unclassified Legionella TaxID=2622702 RepID=UPI00105659A8|nr:MULTISPECIES: YraN family protein [unclassified Legionella]MDI9818002.1 YraN family protein [Legionella sp. PL877]